MVIPLTALTDDVNRLAPSVPQTAQGRPEDGVLARARFPGQEPDTRHPIDRLRLSGGGDAEETETQDARRARSSSIHDVAEHAFVSAPAVVGQRVPEADGVALVALDERR
jgi:hypothetical protein